MHDGAVTFPELHIQRVAALEHLARRGHVYNRCHIYYFSQKYQRGPSTKKTQKNGLPSRQTVLKENHF